MTSWFALGLADFSLVGLIGLLTGAVGGWFSKYLFPSILQRQRHVLEVQSEEHRAELKRKEMLFASELMAAENLLSFVDQALDQFAGPDHDDPDIYYDQIGRNFNSFEEKISLLIRKHEAALPDTAVDRLKTARNEAKRGSHSCAVDELDAHSSFFELSKQTLSNAKTMEKCLREASTSARSSLRTSSSSQIATK